jgi:hypothetical protein
MLKISNNKGAPQVVSEREANIKYFRPERVKSILPKKRQAAKSLATLPWNILAEKAK